MASETDILLKHWEKMLEQLFPLADRIIQIVDEEDTDYIEKLKRGLNDDKIDVKPNVSKNKLNITILKI